MTSLNNVATKSADRRLIILQVLLILILVSCLPILNPTFLNGDVEMILHPAKILASTGKLNGTDQLTPAQVLRDGADPFRNPYALAYFAPVLLFAIAIKIFGANDLAFFGVQTILWLVLYLLVRDKLKSSLTTSLFFLTLVVLGTFDGATYLSPTQLPVICLYVALWGDWEKKHGRIFFVFCGLALGVGLSFRPETIFLILTCSVGLLFTRNSKKTDILILILSTFLSYTVLQKLRSTLGAVDGADHMFYNLGTEIFGPGWSVLNVERITPLSEMLSNPSLIKKLILKLAHGFNRTFTLRPLLLSRNDFFFLLILLSSLFFKTKKRLAYIGLASLFIFQFFINTFLNDVSRYYDYVFVLIGLQIWKDYFPVSIHKQPNLNRMRCFTLATVILVILLGQSARNVWAKRNYFTVAEPDYRRKLESVMKHFSDSDLILSNNGMDLLWYGNAKRVIFAPQIESTMEKIIQRFPRAKVINFTDVPNGIFEGLIPLKDFSREQVASDIFILSRE